MFDDWNYENGHLYLSSGHSRTLTGDSHIVKRYVVDGSESLNDLIEQEFMAIFPNEPVYTDASEDHYSPKFFQYLNLKTREYMKIYHTQADYCVKSSPNKEYCAVYSRTGIHCDIYQQINSETGSLVSGRNYGKYLFTLVRNGDWIVELVNHPQTQETLLLFYQGRGVLDVYDMSGKIKYTQGYKNVFMNRLEWINDKYFLLHAQVPQPWAVCYIYNLNYFLEQLENPSLPFITKDIYSHIEIWFEGDEEKNYPKVVNGKVVMGLKIIEELDNYKLFEPNRRGD